MTRLVHGLLAAWIVAVLATGASGSTRKFAFSAPRRDFAAEEAETVRSPLIGQPIPDQYIVQMSPSYGAAQVKEFQSSVLDANQVTVLHTFDIDGHNPTLPHEAQADENAAVFSGFAIRTTSSEALAALANDPRVEMIEADSWAGVSAPTTILRQTNSSWNLNRIWVRQLPFGNTYNYASNAGAGVNAYVIDTGVYAPHQDFTGRVQTGTTFITNEAATDLNGHGSHVAGTIGGVTYGVAKQVSIVPVKVLNAAGLGSWSNVIAGIQFAVQHAKAAGRRGVINMSIEGGKTLSVNNAIGAAVAAGLHVVVAAGNSNKDACLMTPGSAVANGAIVVGNTNNQDSRNPSSNYGTCVSLFAPGTSILSCGYTGPTTTRVMTGTSMASPHVAGVVAVYLSYKAYTPAAMAAILRSTATKTTVTNLPATPASPSIVLYADPNGCASCSPTSYAEDSGVWARLTRLFAPVSPSSVEAADGDSDSEGPSVPPNEDSGDESSPSSALRSSSGRRLRWVVERVRISRMVAYEESTEASD